MTMADGRLRRFFAARGYPDPATITTAGPITLQRPKLRNTTERFASQLFGKGVTKTNALEALVIAGFVRGLSTRDVEAALTEALGASATVSRSTVSRICTEIKVQFEAWSARRLDDVELDYLFLDGSHFTYHANSAAEPVLAGWGIDTDGNVTVPGPYTYTGVRDLVRICWAASIPERMAGFIPPLLVQAPARKRLVIGVW